MTGTSTPTVQKTTSIGYKIVLIVALCVAISVTAVFIVYLARRAFAMQERAVTIINELNDSVRLECEVHNKKVRKAKSLAINETFAFWFQELITDPVQASCNASTKTLVKHFDVWGGNASRVHGTIYTLSEYGIYLGVDKIYSWDSIVEKTTTITTNTSKPIVEPTRGTAEANATTVTTKTSQPIVENATTPLQDRKIDNDNAIEPESSTDDETMANGADELANEETKDSEKSDEPTTEGEDLTPNTRDEATDEHKEDELAENSTEKPTKKEKGDSESIEKESEELTNGTKTTTAGNNTDSKGSVSNTTSE